MSLVSALYRAPKTHLLTQSPDHPVLYFAPSILQATARRFQKEFPGLVTYAVKANDAEEVLENLMAAGLDSFDVASPFEMKLVRRLMPSANLHYNNPIRSAAEISTAVELGVASFSIDSLFELKKLEAGGIPLGTEISVRIRLPISGAAYDFGAKFGADPDTAVALLKSVVAIGYAPSMTFHPGTQCADPSAWRAYIKMCADIAQKAGVTLRRLNVGGGFAAHRTGPAPDLGAIFKGIQAAVVQAFGQEMPALVCEPGRAMVADAFSLAARVKGIRDDGDTFLNDGIYGGLAEAPVLGNVDRFEIVSTMPRIGACTARMVYGPTCDSLDRLPDTLSLPDDLEEGDWVLFHGLGAYSTATVTRFNGYGAIEVVTVDRLA
ncbi:MAG: type III PLP-dependent enzyme [Boseongicola sp.]|nr:MAG: type III PLP-dependent enzyme [Boseongicola sp.]